MYKKVGLANENSNQGAWWKMSLEQRFTIHSFAVQNLMLSRGSPRKGWKTLTYKNCFSSNFRFFISVQAEI